jgi:hypothetical protein
MQVLEAILDPLDRRRLEDLLPAATERVDLVAERLDAPLGFDQGLSKRLAPAALADEVDEVRQPALLGREFASLSFRVSGRSERSLAISCSTRRRT